MRIHDIDFEKIIKDLNNNDIEKVDLFDYEGEDITEERIAALSKALKINTSVRVIHFPGMGKEISDKEAKWLAEAISANKSIEEVYLCYVSITDRGALFFIDAIKKNSSIKELGLPKYIDKIILLEIKYYLLLNDEIRDNQTISSLGF